MTYTLEEAFKHVEMPVVSQLELKKRYSEPHRKYHNLSHIEEMLKWVPNDHPEVFNIIEAILYHDIVHSPSFSPDGLDETLSCAEYIVYTFSGLHHMTTTETPFGFEGKGSLLNERRVLEAINATARHTQDQKHLCDVAQIVLDLDLSTFALPWEEYQVWTVRLMEELSLKYPDVDITKGRQVFLAKLLEREKLYYVNTHWEDPARENIKRDLRV
jgi:predicted metal-dependent HD superfamily phosphohydrolase